MKKKLIVFSMVLVMLISLPIMTISAEDNYDDVWLQDQIDNVSSGGTIVLDKDVVFSNTVSLPSKRFTIDGGNSFALKLASGFEGRHFNGGADLTLSNLSLLGHNEGIPTKDFSNRVVGGGIKTTRGSYQKITLNNVVASGNHFDFGGVMNLGNTPVIINDSTFLNNTSNQGGVINTNNSNLKIDKSTFRNNVTTDIGGAVFAVYSKVDVNESTFENNIALSKGGAGTASQWTIKNSNFIGNEAQSGGAIESREKATITDSKFSSNKAVATSSSGSYGGAIIVSTNLHPLTVTDTVFENNTAMEGSGGAISVNGETNKNTNIILTNVDFINNRAKEDGMRWDVESPKKLVSGSTIMFDQIPSAEAYIKNIKDVTTDAKSSDDRLYDTVFNNHDITFYSRYAVYFFKDSKTMKSVNHSHGMPLTPPAGFTEEEGKVFKGWAIIPSQSLGWIPEDWDPTVPYMWDETIEDIHGQVSLFALWNDVYTMTFETDGGSTVDPITAEKDTAFIEPDKPTYEGHEFKGWFKDEEKSIPYDFSTLAQEDITLYAKWEKKIVYYTVTYTDGSDKEIYFKDQVDVVQEGKDTPEYEKEISRYGYTFTGWNPKVTDTVTGDVVYVAQWQAIDLFTVRYTDGVENEEIFKDQITTVYRNDPSPIFEGPKPTRNGYTFVGWSPDYIGVVTDNVVYTAVWKVVEVPVTPVTPPTPDTPKLPATGMADSAMWYQLCGLGFTMVVINSRKRYLKK